MTSPYLRAASKFPAMRAQAAERLGRRPDRPVRPERPDRLERPVQQDKPVKPPKGKQP